MTRVGARLTVLITVLLAEVLCLAMLCAAAAPAQAARPITRAFTDDVWFTAGSRWVPRTVATGAKMVLLEVDWISVEPKPPPPGVDPTDPAGPEYSFSYLDARVREFAGSGLSIAFLVGEAPPWAETPGGPASLEADGAWEPNATAYGQMAEALARRYSGSYPDPLHPGHTLPRVRFFQAWGEANLSIHLAPQWTRSNGTWVPASPGIYRNLLNAFYAGVKSVHPDNVVITTGVAPFGDPPGGCTNHVSGEGCRMHPVDFARDLMCLQGEALRAATCPNPAHFDAVASDPYEVLAPTYHAANPDDVTAPDLGKLTRIVDKAVSLGLALPRAHKQLWVTEFSYDSNPPNPGAVSLATQARWLDEALYIFWSEGVNAAVWYLVRDQAPTYNPDDYFSGVYFYNGTPKPSFQAYRFPFVVMPSGSAVDAWGISPLGGKLAVQHFQGGRWRTLFHVRVSAGGTFVRRISRRLRGRFRAVVGAQSSLVWTR